MSDFNRRGYTVLGNSQGKQAVKIGGKAERIAAHRRRQMTRTHKARVDKYKSDLREAKKKIPLAERSRRIDLSEL